MLFDERALHFAEKPFLLEDLQGFFLHFPAK